MTCSRAGAFLPKKNGPRRAGPRPKFATRRMQPAALGSQRTGRLVPMVGAGRRVEGATSRDIATTGRGGGPMQEARLAAGTDVEPLRAGQVRRQSAERQRSRR